ncbi:hypothetical protein FA13DRAFT_1727248 [Coprinellus micaceus]|uniref:Uncharacterized protein n=1 Tax=Coprinellus micaceus TaxID=71717 RepID=A0A4Y7TRR4_COPMI|nr:hypothetical protein FA13DRAFT_1727248 [Coprinellus micaceus]
MGTVRVWQEQPLCLPFGSGGTRFTHARHPTLYPRGPHQNLQLKRVLSTTSFQFLTANSAQLSKSSLHGQLLLKIHRFPLRVVVTGCTYSYPQLQVVI